MLGHVLTRCSAAGDAVAVVVGPEHDECGASKAFAPDAKIFVQRERRGTAHAVLAAPAGHRAGADECWWCSATRR